MTDKIFGPLSFMSPSLQFNVACCSRNGHPQAALFEGGTGLSSSLLDMKNYIISVCYFEFRGEGASYFCHSLEEKT